MMRTMLKIFGSLLLAITLFPLPSQSQTMPSCASDDVALLFCDAMQDEKLYDQNNFDSYKTLIAGRDGWIFRSQSDLRTDFSLSKEALDNLKELNAAFESKGIKLVMLLTPTRGMMHSEFLRDEDKKKYKFKDIDTVWRSYWKAVEAIRETGIHVVGIERPAPGQSFFYKRDHHWNPTGARLAAQTLAHDFQKLPAYKNIEKVEYITREDGIYDFHGVSKKVFKRLCGTRQPPERIIKQITEQAGIASDQTDLFGEVNNPEIVLLGTSNSTMEPSFANFEGALKEELSADVLNMSVSGGGLDTAMISYLNSDFYKNNPAKIAVWEVPAYYDISNQKNFFREAVAASYGECNNSMVAEAKNIPLNEESSILALDRLSSKKITGDDYYVNVNFSQPVSKPFYLDLRYIKNRDKYRFQRSGRYPSDGQFFLSLRDDKKEALDKVVLEIPQQVMGNTVSVQLCKKELGDKNTIQQTEQQNNTDVNYIAEKLKQTVNF